LIPTISCDRGLLLMIDPPPRSTIFGSPLLQFRAILPRRLIAITFVERRPSLSCAVKPGLTFDFPAFVVQDVEGRPNARHGFDRPWARAFLRVRHVGAKRNCGATGGT